MATSSRLIPSPGERRIQIGAGELFVRDIGRGTPIVALHGGPDFDHQYLVPDLDRLADTFRLITYAQRGRGASSGDVRAEDVGLASEIADLDALRTRLGLDSVALLGHSWGGLLAMEYAIRHPDRVSRLVLMNCGPASRADYARLREARTRAAAGDSERMAAIAATPRYQSGELAADAEYYRIHFGATVRDPDRLERLLNSLRANFTPATILLARQIEDRLMDETWSLAGYDLFPALRTLRVPALVIHGQHDLIPEEGARHIADAIPGARFVLVPDCGHFSFMEAPEAVSAAIGELLA